MSNVKEQNTLIEGSQLFDNFPQESGYIPNNRPYFEEPEITTIVIGSNVTHTFDVPYNIMTDLKNLEIIYKQGTTKVLVKDRSEVSYQIIDAHQTILACKLTPTETLLFENTLLDTLVQIKFYFNDNTIDYSNVMKVVVLKGLDY